MDGYPVREMDEKSPPARGRAPSFLVNPHPKRPFREAVARLPLGGLATICEEAQCPNRGECLSKHGTVSIMVMGSVCTRACPFCAVKHGKPAPLDPDEPRQVVELARALGVRYLVMTSPNRDELPDGGASQFARIVKALRSDQPLLKIEILVPDFLGREDAYQTLLESPPDVLAHDLQTVPRLYAKIRPGARYERSIGLFRWFSRKAAPSRLWLKGGLMVGFGETVEEVEEVLRDSADAGVKFFTIGQYLKPPGSVLEAFEIVPLERYEEYRKAGERFGIKVQASPLTRSSYLADKLTNL
jgi:lipoic acid synthetase